MTRAAALLALSALSALAACGSDEIPLDEWGRPTLEPTGWSDGEEKSDNINGRKGLPTSVDSASTQVWAVTNQWADTNTTAAKAAGMAWPADSGMNWDEKYRAWVESLERVDCEDCWGDTFRMTTPYGKVLPSPSLECAEMAQFLRVTFASWYGLPYFVEGSIDGQRVFFGHFGVRTVNGRWKNTPNYKTAYPDYSNLASAIAGGTASWPSDAKLRARTLYGSFDDDQPQISADAHAGTYFDELFLNKRVGHFLMLHLVYFGSVNLADTANMYNIKPESTRPGDVLVKRYDYEGIGHTLIVKKRRDYPEATVDGETLPQFDLELASGSMPRRQPQWDSATSSKFSLTANAGGGKEHGLFGGGIKRWRIARSVQGQWTNVIMPDDVDIWVSSADLEAIEARPELFDKYFVELSAEEKLTALLQTVEAERAWLREHPSSCAARTRREEAFEEVYELAETELELTRAQVDAEHRVLDDYVFAELDYMKSKTCCWNSTTRAMYDVIIAQATDAMTDEGTGECRPAPVFRARNDGSDGFELYRQKAAEQGRSADWVAWSADEYCPWSGVAEDTEDSSREITPMCEALPQ